MITKEGILNILRAHKSEFYKYGVSNIGLFGSHLRNEQSNKSDIDLLIDFEPEKENFDNYMAMYDLFESLFKNERIEIVTKKRAEQIYRSQYFKKCTVCLRNQLNS